MIAVQRNTSETNVLVQLVQGAGNASIETTVPFLDHMLGTLARYSELDLTVRASGDLRHHIIEDVGITLGTSLRKLVTPTIARYTDRTIAMDDALVQAAVDLGGRAYYEGPLPSTMYDHFFRSFSFSAAATLHLRVIRGRDRHHVVEAAFKAVGLSLYRALLDDGMILSTKGDVDSSGA